MLEGFARVVEAKDGLVWCEPEQTSSCGGCASQSFCGQKSGSKRLELRRFQLVNDQGLRVGDRIVVGIPESALLRGAMTAYGLPLLGMLIAGVTLQKVLGSDAAGAAGAAGGMALGLLAARIKANGLSARGDLSPVFLRRLYGSEPSDCSERDA